MPSNIAHLTCFFNDHHWHFHIHTTVGITLFLLPNPCCRNLKHNICLSNRNTCNISVLDEHWSSTGVRSSTSCIIIRREYIDLNYIPYYSKSARPLATLSRACSIARWSSALTVVDSNSKREMMVGTASDARRSVC